MNKDHDAAEEKWFKNRLVIGVIISVAFGMFFITTGIWKYYYDLRETDINQGNQLTLTKTTLTGELTALKTEITMMRKDLNVVKNNQQEIFKWIKNKESKLGEEKHFFLLPDGEFRLSSNGNGAPP